LRPLDLAARVVANDTRVRALLAHDADLRLLRVSILKSIGEPVGHTIAHDDDVGRGRLVCLALRLRRDRIIRRRFTLLALLAWLAWLAPRPRILRIAKPAPTKRIELLLRLILRLLPLWLILRLLPLRMIVPLAPELRAGRNGECKAHGRRGTGSRERP